jgi:hypothetical protein
MTQKLVIRLLVIVFMLSALQLPTPTRAQDYQISFTDIVLENTGALPVYTTPSAGAGAVYSLPPGSRFLWNGVTSQVAEGRTWLRIYLIDRLEVGWITPDSGTIYQTDTFRLTPGMEIGATAQLAQARELLFSARLHRPAADAGQVLGMLPAGTSVYVTDGPVFNQLQVFWKIKTSAGEEGWIVDGGGTLNVVAPLKVYNVNVCDNFNIKRFGVAGWDSFMQAIRRFIPTSEAITCLASSNLRGDNLPVVTVLTSQGDSFSVIERVRVFELNAGQWVKIFEIAGNAGDRTERLGVYDLTGDGIPKLVWMTRVDGTGHYLNVQAFAYRTGTLTPIFSALGLYKGNVQLGVGNILLFQPVLRANEPNCCPTGFNRQAFQWVNNQFVKTLDDQPISPFAIQGIPQ